MKIKNKYSYSDGNQIWRIKISDKEKLLIETRNTDKKETFFHCFELKSGKPIFTKQQMQEKYWLGVEAIHNDLILFHKFAKPDMPGHKGIFAFDIMSKKVLWENESYAFLFILENKIYVYQERFEGKHIYTLNPVNGELIEDLGQNPSSINELKNIADTKLDYSNYTFPEFFCGSSSNQVIDELINKETNKHKIEGEIEYVIKNGFLIFNYHSQNKNKRLLNTITAYNVLKRKKVFSEILNTNLNAFAPDSFFLYNNLLVLIYEKTKVFVYELVE